MIRWVNEWMDESMDGWVEVWAILGQLFFHDCPTIVSLGADLGVGGRHELPGQVQNSLVTCALSVPTPLSFPSLSSLPSQQSSATPSIASRAPTDQNAQAGLKLVSDSARRELVQQSAEILPEVGSSTPEESLGSGFDPDSSNELPWSLFLHLNSG